LGTGSGFGKVILFGEHFVVHGIPSIVSAIGDFTNAEVTPEHNSDNQEFRIVDDRPETPGYKKKKLDQQEASIKLMLEHANIEQEDKTLLIKFGGPLLAASGVGASAASCVAFARALNDEYRLKMTDPEINRMAYEGEKGYHGIHPSGVDNTAATYGGLIQFTKGETPKFDHIKTPKQAEIVMGNTGLTADTTEVVDGVFKRKEKEPEKYIRIFQQARDLIPKARGALEAGDFKKIGELMMENHKLLQEIEVSCDELDHLVGLSLKTGAWGAKMTGTGRGGYMIALTPGTELQNRVAEAIKDEGFNVLKTTIGV
jgi:mevalonate kinase